MKLILSFNKHKTAAMIFLSVTLALCIASICSVMVRRNSQLMQNEARRYLTEISEQSAYIVNQSVSNNLTSLQNMAETISILSKTSPELCRPYLNQTITHYSFIGVALVNKEGILAAKGDSAFNYSSHPAIKAALDGQPCVSSGLITDMQGNQGILYAVPYIDEKGISGALIAWDSVDTLGSLLSAKSFGGQGFSHIVDKKGNFIVRSDNSQLKCGNIFNGMAYSAGLSADELSDIRHHLDQKESGHIHLNIDGEEEAMSYAPLRNGDWYLFSVVPSNVYDQAIRSFTINSLLLASVPLIIFVILVIGVIGLERKKNQEISKIAYVDPVTLGYTSPKFDLELTELSKNFTPFSFLSLDLRKFKLINDSFGSESGNRVLKHVHDTIKAYLKEGEFVSRISADTFNLIFLSTSKEEITQRLYQIAEAINAFNENLETPYYLPVNCGIFLVQEPQYDIIHIRDRANTARKINKNNQNGEQRLFSCVFYSDVERLQLLKEKEMENNMERALENREFLVYLQPKVSLSSSRVAGAEALIRWQTPDKGLVPPNDFIPFFEKNGFIVKLDLFVFEEVCRLLRQWIDQGLSPVPISVNLSRVHLRVSNFLDEFKAIQEKYQIPPGLLEIELTETMVFENLDFLKQVISQIHNMGFSCSMDDFGSGYSSLNVLKDVPVDILKLDKVFFDNGEDDERANDVIESVIKLARKLGMTTISEGVETLPQVDFLKQVQCDMVQGYVFSKPLPVKDFEKLVYF